MDALCKEIDRIADSTNFNGIKLLDGSLGGGTGGNNLTNNTVAPTGAWDATNAAKLGDPTFAFDANAEDVAKAAFNTALGEGKEITFTVAEGGGTAGTFEAGDTLTITGLPDGYTYEITDLSGAAHDATTAITHATTGTTAGTVDLTQELAITVKDADGNAVGTLTLAASANIAEGASKLTLTAGDPAQAPATAAAGDAGDVEAAAPTFTGNPTALAKFGLQDGMDLTNFKGTIDADTDVKLAYDGTGGAEKLTLTVGTTTYEFDASAFTAAGDDEIEFINTADPTDKIKMTTDSTAANVKFGTGVTANIAEESIGGLKPADNNGGNNGAGNAGSLTLQIGEDGQQWNQMDVAINDMHVKQLFAGSGVTIQANKTDGEDTISISTQGDAQIALDAIRTAVNTVSTQRAKLGAIQNRLEHTINNLDVASENMNSANSRVRDTDMAKQMMSYTQMNVLTQAAQAMLAQANQQPQSVLQLLQ
ncbi:MAG: hypothetical protein HFG26_05345 [Provencibacterium sp.]|nr:hypothetical protein [Provencibacterium sp.]